MKILESKFAVTKSIPPGAYVGIYSGYLIKIPMANGNYELRTDEGIRGTAAVQVTVQESGEIVIRR